MYTLYTALYTPYISPRYNLYNRLYIHSLHTPLYPLLIYTLYTPYILPIQTLYTLYTLPYILLIQTLYTPSTHCIYCLYDPCILPIYSLYTAYMLPTYSLDTESRARGRSRAGPEAEGIHQPKIKPKPWKFWSRQGGEGSLITSRGYIHTYRAHLYMPYHKFGSTSQAE